MTTQGWGPPRQEPAQDGEAPLLRETPLMQVMSHDEGRNAVVTLYPDRIERVKARSALSLSKARQDTEVIPIRAISSVQAKKAGFRTNVTVYASGNNVDFRIAHAEAQIFKDAVMQLVLAPPEPPQAAPANGGDVADLIRKLGELRDQGLLTEEEFNAKKRKLLDL